MQRKEKRKKEEKRKERKKVRYQLFRITAGKPTSKQTKKSLKAGSASVANIVVYTDTTLSVQV